MERQGDPSNSNARTFTARWVFPVSGPPLPHGTVAVQGDSIAAVEPHGVRTPDEDLGNVALIPGLVNAHTHLDLSGARGRITPTDPAHFTDWLRGVIAFRRTRTPEQTQADTRAGLAECLRFGTTLLGDIASEGASWATVAAAQTRAVIYYELIGLNYKQVEAAWNHTSFVSGINWYQKPPPGTAVHPATPTCRWGISPHAPYSVNVHTAKAIFQMENLTATHLAESPHEAELLERRTGPFVEFLTALGIYQKDALASNWVKFLTPVVSGKVPRSTLIIHGNYLSPEFPFLANQSVVYCPRTHAAFGHPPHPFRKFLERGVRVCLGTDSLASNPDLDILAEARFVHARYPDFPADALLRMVTLSGAEALGWADVCGSLEAGKSADMVAVPLPDRDAPPHELLFANHPAERRTMFRGEWRGEASP